MEKKEVKEKQVRIRFSQEDYAVLQEYASLRGLPTSTAVRMLALTQLKAEIILERDKELERKRHADMFKQQMGR